MWIICQNRTQLAQFSSQSLKQASFYPPQTSLYKHGKLRASTNSECVHQEPHIKKTLIKLCYQFLALIIDYVFMLFTLFAFLFLLTSLGVGTSFHPLFDILVLYSLPFIGMVVYSVYFGATPGQKLAAYDFDFSTPAHRRVLLGHSSLKWGSVMGITVWALAESVNLTKGGAWSTLPAFVFEPFAPVTRLYLLIFLACLIQFLALVALTAYERKVGMVWVRQSSKEKQHPE